MTTDFKQIVDYVVGAIVALGAFATSVASLIASCFAIAWYAHRFHELYKERKKNGNKQ